MSGGILQHLLRRDDFEAPGAELDRRVVVDRDAQHRDELVIEGHDARALRGFVGAEERVRFDVTAGVFPTRR